MGPEIARLSLVSQEPEQMPGRISAPATVRLTGELDLATAPQVAEELRAALATSRRVVVDLRALRFIDVAGMRVLLVASARARENGRHLVMVRGPAQVDGVFTLTGSDVLIETVDLDPSDAAELAATPAVSSAPPIAGIDWLKAWIHHRHDASEQRIEARLRRHLDLIVPRGAELAQPGQASSS